MDRREFLGYLACLTLAAAATPALAQDDNGDPAGWFYGQWSSNDEYLHLKPDMTYVFRFDGKTREGRWKAQDDGTMAHNTQVVLFNGFGDFNTEIWREGDDIQFGYQFYKHVLSRH